MREQVGLLLGETNQCQNPYQAWKEEGELLSLVLAPEVEVLDALGRGH